jgi:acetyl-CoA carboxylase carboxyl transferase subunit alpha
VLIGEGGSGGALALAVADRVWMLENAIYSVISPEGCASILWKDASRSADAAQSLKLTAQDAFELGVVECIIPEDDIGKEPFYASLKALLDKELGELAALPPDQLTQNRYLRFRKFGEKNIIGG